MVSEPQENRSSRPGPQNRTEIDAVSRLGDWTTLGSVATLAVLSLFTRITLLPFTGTASVMFGGTERTWFIIYCALFGLLFIPKLDRLQIWLFARDTRDPTPEERSVLQPVWEQALTRTGKGRHRAYRLRISDLKMVNAFAVGGSVVVVTRYALTNLPASQLEAVLIHELGHHIGLHPVMLLAREWLMYPIRLVYWFATRTQRILASILLVRMSWKAQLATLIIVASLQLALLGLRTFLGIIHYILMFISRIAEYRADRTAVMLGAGPQLADALESMTTNLSQTPRRQSLLDTWGATHPPTNKRIERIHKATRKITHPPHAS